jgi:uncharacterized membrane protein YhiD involved in acid resistance
VPFLAVQMTVVSGFLASSSALGVGDFAARAAVALVLGALIGLERQWRQRMAGLRTNALVALGAALFELFSVLLRPAEPRAQRQLRDLELQ